MRKNLIFFIFFVGLLIAGIVFLGPRLDFSINTSVAAQQNASPDSNRSDTNPSENEKITRQDVNDFLQSSDKALNSMDIEKVRSMYWDDAEISFLRSTKVIQIPLEGYLAKIHQKWGTVTQYSNRFQLERVELKDSRALVLGTVEELGQRPDGLKIRTTAQSRKVLEKRDGRIKKIYEEVDLDKTRNEVME